jgi:hypothetical protein
MVAGGWLSILLLQFRLVLLFGSVGNRRANKPQKQQRQTPSITTTTKKSRHWSGGNERTNDETLLRAFVSSQDV